MKRFWNKVEKTNTCWLWTASKSHNGYGVIWIKDIGNVRVHRFSWELHVGPIPDGLCVLHKCDVPACVNPEHLFLGTRKDNAADMVKKGRSLVGVRNSNAKLTPDIIVLIRAATGSMDQIAERFDVCQRTICQIRNRKTWSHII